MFDVQSNTGPEAVSLTSIVTVSVPSVNVPSSTGSTLSSIQVAPSGASSPHVAFSPTGTGADGDSWAELAPAPLWDAPIKHPAPISMVISPAAARLRRPTRSSIIVSHQGLPQPTPAPRA
jgi:hypothetical protein